jgi:hypothetical protein
VIRDTLPRARDDNSGAGVHVQMSASLVLRRALVTRNLGHGVAATSAGRADLADVVVTDTAPEAGSGWFGRGVACAGGASCTLARVELERSDDTGLSGTGDGTTITAEDVTVRDTGATSTTAGRGRGINVQLGAVADLVRVLVTGSSEGGVVALGTGTQLHAVDLTVADPPPSDAPNRGRGIDVELGVMAVIERARVEGSRQFGILVLGSSVALEDVSVLGTRAHVCPALGCEVLAAGTALASLRRASVMVDGFVIRDADLCGVQLAGESSLDLRNGLVREAEIGACVQVDGYDLSRLMEDVVYRDNAVNADTTMLPVPDPSAPISGEDG